MLRVEVLHGTGVALGGAGLLILGPAGSGKSSLALSLMALGAALVADDRTELRRPDDGPPVMSAPLALRGLIEARGIGILRAEAQGSARLVLCVDLGAVEPDRLPQRRWVRLLDCAVPLLHKPASGDAAPALLQYLKGAPWFP